VSIFKEFVSWVGVAMVLFGAWLVWYYAPEIGISHQILLGIPLLLSIACILYKKKHHLDRRMIYSGCMLFAGILCIVGIEVFDEFAEDEINLSIKQQVLFLVPFMVCTAWTVYKLDKEERT
jgi:hypothetical protein